MKLYKDMVIQRWQTVWLLVATVLVAVFCCIPMAIVPGEVNDPNSVTFMRPVDVPVFMVVNIVVACVLFLSILLYKNTRRQKTLTLVSMLLIVVVMVTEVLLLYSWNDAYGGIEWLGSIFLLLAALVFALLAYRGINHDERLLKAADRLR